MSEPLFTVKMFAELLDVPIYTVRSWRQRGLIKPSNTVGRLDYFSSGQFQNAKIFAKLYHAGLHTNAIANKIESLWRTLNIASGMSIDLPLVIVGRDIWFERDNRTIDENGQQAFAFDEAVQTKEPQISPDVFRFDNTFTPQEKTDNIKSLMLEAAWDCEDAGDLKGAIRIYREIAEQQGADAAICFQMAELFYRLGNLDASRERYSMALELDKNFVEARANLGCVLAEQGDFHTAVKTFDEVLKQHPDYADVHFHLARTLDSIGQNKRAEYHRQLYKSLMPSTDPWNN
ncbi:MAG: tetratricopeptide repeat protein [Planctomycetaceae bacterium]|jgi:Tfp pilus assembly protein PilF|nr:tetratricopeptide repeat protein [Planctomycetaceae bacterium]